MIITEVRTGWWKLESQEEQNSLIWFGYTKAEVVYKFTAWLRKKDLEKLR